MKRLPVTAQIAIQLNITYLQVSWLTQVNFAERKYFTVSGDWSGGFRE